MTGMDAATQGLAVYTALAVIAGALTRRAPATIAIWAGVGWVPWLLVHSPYLGGTALLGIGWLAVHRYGLRHLLRWGGLAAVYSVILLARVRLGGTDFGAAALDAAGITLRFAAWTAICWVTWRLVTERVGYLTNPLAWAAETRRVQQLAEHKRAMGLGKQGLGRLGTGTRKALTARRPDKTPPSDGPRVETVPATSDLGIPDPLFHPQPRRRRPRP